ncbi:MAG: hypothetical protein ACREI5_05150 [Candidatus Methylomirabilales bacterium]
MKLKTSHNAARERLDEMIVSGNTLLDKVTGEYYAAKTAGAFSEEQHIPQWKEQYVDWLHKCLGSLQDIFPTPQQAITLNNAQGSGPLKMNVKWASLTADIKAKLSTLESTVKSVDDYSIEMTDELFIEDIDSFAKARDINPRQVKRLLPLNLSADQVRTFFGEILGEPLRRPDEEDAATDIFTSTVRTGGDRARAALLLKGATTRGKLTLKKCGKRGEQIARLVAVPAELYMLQHLDQIETPVIRELKTKIQSLNGEGKQCRICLVDGMDTARILVAYGKISL